MSMPSKQILVDLKITDKQILIVQNYYCSTLSRLGKCAHACENCQDRLVHIIEQSHSFVNPRNPEGVLVWCIRESLAQIQEQEENVKPVPVNWLGERINDDPFEMFLRTLK